MMEKTLRLRLNEETHKIDIVSEDGEFHTYIPVTIPTILLLHNQQDAYYKAEIEGDSFRILPPALENINF